jgi:hypothetical protein
MTLAQNTSAYIQGFEDGKRASFRLIEEAVKAEREACARVCEAQDEYGDEQYAAAVRARGNT